MWVCGGQDTALSWSCLCKHLHLQVIHNVNTVMSWNALDVAAELGHKRVSLASSINAIGLSTSNVGGTETETGLTARVLQATDSPLPALG